MSKKNGLTVLFYPSFDNSEEFTDHYYRVVWYLNPLQERIGRIVMPYEGESLSVGTLPYYLDPAIKQMADGPGIADVVDLISSRHTGLLQDAAKEADVVLVWRVAGSGQGDAVPDGPVKSIVMKKKRYSVDHKRMKYAGSHYLKLSAEICTNDATVKECSKRFKQIPTHNFKKTGYIYGNGPSLKSALEMDLSEGTSIICNTIVKNKELMHKVKPPIIVIGDPIFHAGCSSYAGEFRRHLLKAMAEFDSYLIVPMRDYAVYMANMDPSLRQRIIGVPFVPGQVPNLNLYKKFHVTTTSNILTLFLIPLAATFFEKTFILGCDGRPLEEDDYFWKHDPASQLGERMDDIQVAHPAFFEISYNDYYLEHCEVLARWLDEAESKGRTFVNLTPSYIPALKARQATSVGVSTESTAMPTVSIVMPAFNASGSISKAIESVQRQSLTDWELVVIDDGSTDNTRQVVEDLITRDPRIRLLTSAGKGVSDARNTGLDATRGEFITFLDADDFMYPGALEQRVKAMRKNPSWNLVHCITQMVDADSKKVGWQMSRLGEVSFRDMSRNACHINSLLGRSRVIKSARFQAGLTNGEDWLFLSDLLRGGEVSHRVDNCLVAYVVRPDSAVCRDYLSHENKLLEVLEMIYSPVRDNLPTAPEFAQGLAWPTKESVILLRRTALLTWLLLEQRANDAVAVSREFSNRDLSQLSKSEIRGRIISTATRFYVCSREEVPEKLLKNRKTILKLISETGVEKAFPRYADEFRALMRKASSLRYRGLYQRLVGYLTRKSSASKWEPTQTSGIIVGPFKRSDQAHIDESALIAALPLGKIKTGVMIDVGAMHGSALFRLCHAGWRVFAFEPDPTNRKEFETRLGHKTNLTIDDRAVADRVMDKMPLYSSAESPGISSLHPFRKSHKEICTVSTTTIADFVREKDLHHIDYLKIDTEGYDFQVLKGVPWDTIKPTVIVCEFEDLRTRSLGYTMHDMARYLTERGYNVLVSEWHPIIRYGIKHDWHRLVVYPCELANLNAWGNLIAFRDQPDLQKIANLAKQVIGSEPSDTTTPSPLQTPSKTTNDSILIIGNGLSTRYLAHLGFDKIPEGVDTFGMGAAYRYYLDIGWWPTYYALCDVKVVFCHQNDLKGIIEDPEVPVRKYFLPLKISDNEKLEVVTHSSTGDFCVRKAIELGYSKIFIIGIETDYIEQIKESKELAPEEIEQLGLGHLEEFKGLSPRSRVIRMITKTPLVNTNYFFDSYQREGDIYSLPRGDKHYSNWQNLSELARTYKVEIINLSPTSPLEMFPKASLDDFLNAKTYHTLPATKLSNTTGHSSRKASKTPTRFLSRDVKKGRSLYRKLVDYLKRNYPTIITIGRLGLWGLSQFKRKFFGMGGIALLVIIGLYVAGALVEPVRWYLVGIASALLLLCGGLLALVYVRLWLNRSFSNLKTQVSDINRKVSDINKQVSDIRRALGTVEATLGKMNVGNFPLFQQFNRRLTDEDLKRFAGEWAPKLGLDLKAKQLAYLAHRICLAEDACVGRLAGHIETMLLRVLVARGLRHEPNLEVLEIGTLFGVGVAMIHESCRGLFDSMHFTIIDPFVGHIGRHDKTPLDVATKAPATREMFIHNMQRMNIPESDYTIIQKLSTEDEAIEQASKRRYNLLIIDGDHSDFGVKHDFFNYRHLVKRGGYIIFDDYGNPNWPGLTSFVDEEVVKMPGLEFVGTDVFAAVFRVIAPQDSTKRERKQHK